MKIFVTILLVWVCNAKVWADDVFKYWDWGQSPARENYEFELLRYALDASSDKYGPYELMRVRQQFTTQRVRREINNADMINVRSGPYLRLSDIDNPAEVNLPVPVPIMHNLLGYRRLIVHKDHAERFTAVNSLTTLNAFSVGLARGWVDVDIYRANHFLVENSANVTTLFSMLEHKRYDFFPSSILALESDLTQSSKPGMLVAVPDVVIVYPFPVVFYVPAGNIRMAERLQFGLEEVSKSGDLTRLLYEHFNTELNYLTNQNLRFIELKNPKLPADFEFFNPQSKLLK